MGGGEGSVFALRMAFRMDGCMGIQVSACGMFYVGSQLDDETIMVCTVQASEYIQRPVNPSIGGLNATMQETHSIVKVNVRRSQPYMYYSVRRNLPSIPDHRDVASARRQVPPWQG